LSAVVSKARSDETGLNGKPQTTPKLDPRRMISSNGIPCPPSSLIEEEPKKVGTPVQVTKTFSLGRVQDIWHMGGISPSVFRLSEDMVSTQLNSTQHLSMATNLTVPVTPEKQRILSRSSARSRTMENLDCSPETCKKLQSLKRTYARSLFDITCRDILQL